MSVSLDAHTCRRPGWWKRRKIQPRRVPGGGDGHRILYVCSACGRGWAWVRDEEGPYWTRYPWADNRPSADPEANQ